MKLEDLEIYRIARTIADASWEMYRELNWQEKKIVGDQFIRAIDSIGANIAEGFGRFHYLDRNKFYYNARGSLQESLHWIDAMQKRGIGDPAKAQQVATHLPKLSVKLNNFITATRSNNSKSK